MHITFLTRLDGGLYYGGAEVQEVTRCRLAILLRTLQTPASQGNHRRGITTELVQSDLFPSPA